MKGRLLSGSGSGFAARRPIDFRGGACVHGGDAEADDYVRPHGLHRRGRQNRHYDSGIRQDIVTGGEKGGETEAAAMMPEADEQQRR